MTPDGTETLEECMRWTGCGNWCYWRGVYRFSLCTALFRHDRVRVEKGP